MNNKPKVLVNVGGSLCNSNTWSKNDILIANVTNNLQNKFPLKSNS